MKVLFTGASSFTGYWFVRALAERGHDVVMTQRQAVGTYGGVRADRVAGLADVGRTVPGCSFGDDRFLALIEEEASWDLMCHHAADVTDYKSPDFDVCAALSNNTRSVRTVLRALSARGCRRVLLTGSVFERGEGAGSEGLPSFSPYGLSKALTADVFRYFADAEGMHLGKFVIPNPFGPYEEPRFTAYLVRTWREGKVPGVNTPDYVRDNIHVSLLAGAYAAFAESLPTEPGFSKRSPSGYVESQGSFAQRFAREMGPRLGMACEVALNKQTDFSEPRIRINTDPTDGERLGWNEQTAWDELAAYYAR